MTSQEIERGNRMAHGSLFSGIGGFDLSAEWMGWENVFHCEINEFCRKVLHKHWPHVKTYTDITKSDFSIHRGSIDVLSGGFPCQPFSAAGKRQGTADNRYLWPAMLAAIKTIQPRWVVGENVSGLVNWSRGVVFEQVQADLEAAGYETFPCILPACSVDAPHRRDRVWIIAYNASGGLQEVGARSWEDVQLYSSRPPNNFNRTDGIARKITKRNIGQLRDYNGVSDWMDRIKSLGNAIVPQIAYQIFKTIEDFEASNFSNGTIVNK